MSNSIGDEHANDLLLQKCSKCNEIKPCSAFSKDKSKKNGIMWACKLCVKIYRKQSKKKIAEKKAAYLTKIAEQKQGQRQLKQLSRRQRRRARLVLRFCVGQRRLRPRRVRFCHYCVRSRQILSLAIGDFLHRLPGRKVLTRCVALSSADCKGERESVCVCVCVCLCEQGLSVSYEDAGGMGQRA